MAADLQRREVCFFREGAFEQERGPLEAGQVVFPADWLARPRDIASAEAARLGEAWGHAIAGSSIAARIEMEHGSPISFPALRSCGAPYRLRSPFGSIDNDTLQFLRNGVGNHWIVTLCAPGSTRAALIFVAAETITQVSESGQLIFSNDPSIIAGSDFFSFGYDSGPRSLLSPEAAIRLGFEATGARIAELPQLIGNIVITQPQQCARWRLTFEKSISVVDPTDGTTHMTNDLYVPAAICLDPTGSLFLATPVDASSVFYIGFRRGPTDPPDSVAVALDYPIQFRRVNPSLSN